MTPVWAQRREALWRDCLVSPDVFHQMVERLGAFVLPDQQVLETEADPHSLPLSLQGLRSHLPRKNAEAIAAWVDVERQVLQDFIGIAPWDHRPLIGGVGGARGQAGGRVRWHHRLRSQQLPQTRHACGGRQAPVVRPPRAGRQRPGGRVHGRRLGTRPCVARLPLGPSPGVGPGPATPPRVCHGPPEVRDHTRQEQCVEMRKAWGEQVPHGWVTGEDALGRHTRFRQALRERGAR